MKTIPVSLVVAGLFIPAILSAQPEPDQREKRPPNGEGPRGGDHRPGGRPGGEGPPDGGPGEGGPGGEGFRGWKRADTDNSGTISREEFDNMPRIQKLPVEKRDRIFSRLDKDGDKVLSAEELKIMDRPPHPGREAMMHFKELDTDHSGGISLEELKAGELFKKLPVEKQEALFKRLDTDGDGQITIKDRPDGPPDGEKGDHPDHGDRPDKGDRPPRDPRRMIKDLDENQDGALSFEEFRKAPPIKNLSEDEQESRFQALDKNGDKKIDESDLPPRPEPGAGGAVPHDGPPPPPKEAPASPKDDASPSDPRPPVK